MSRVESVVKFNINNYFEKSQKTDIQNNTVCAVATQPVTAKYTAKNLQAYYCTQPSFGHLDIQHLKNCGAYVDKSKKVFFSLFTYDDVEKVFVVLKKAGAKKQVEYPMKKDSGNIFRAELSSIQARHGDRYTFKVVKNNGESMLLPDPKAQRKTDFKSVFSEIYDHSLFEWTDKDWLAGKKPARISRLENSGLTPYRQTRVLEVNIPTFSKEGTFDGAINKIAKLIKKGVFKTDGTGVYNTVEIMPVESSYAPGWGYDGVFKSAPMEAYGGPDGLKRFNNYLHSKSINSIIDAVPNHFGDDGNPLGLIGPYFNKVHIQGGFGERPNFENDPKNNSQIRDFISDACGLNWLRDYHFDGVRLDFTNQMDSDNALRQLIEEINFHEPNGIVILEDTRVELTNKLCRPVPSKVTPEEHVHSIEKYSNNTNSLDEVGANGRWGYEVEHCMSRLLKGETNVTDLYYNIMGAIARGDVLYGMRQSHDEAGNMDGIKAVVDLTSNNLGMFKKRIAGNSDKEKGQRAAQATQAILKEFVSGQYTSDVAKEISEKYHVTSMPSIEEIEKALTVAIAKNKISQSIISTVPNTAKMQFSSLTDVTPFRFFRTFSKNAEADYKMLEAEKGYRAGKEALEDSKPDSIPYTEEYKKTMEKVDQYQIDLNEIIQSNEALKSGDIISGTTYDSSNIFGTHIKKDKDEVFTVSNLSDFSYNGDYKIQFPQGKWQVVICSEDTKYAGSGQHIQMQHVVSDGKNKNSISIPANSFTLFKKIG